MEAESTTTTDTCQAQCDEPPGYWHTHDCTNRAKATVTNPDGRQVRVCGVHLRGHERHGITTVDPR